MFYQELGPISAAELMTILYSHAMSIIESKEAREIHLSSTTKERQSSTVASATLRESQIGDRRLIMERICLTKRHSPAGEHSNFVLLATKRVAERKIPGCRNGPVPRRSEPVDPVVAKG